MLQKLIWFINKNLYARFVKESFSLERTQKSVLKNILSYNKETTHSSTKKMSGFTYDEFTSVYPVTNYSDWKDLIESEKNGIRGSICKEIKRFQGTSGSTQEIKWIPYNTKILNEFDKASSAWIFDLGLKYPGILKGKHYWSLSWIPDNLKASLSSDDKELLPFWKRHLMTKVMVPNPKVVECKSSDDCFFATLIELIANKDLSLISVWSPTFAINLIHKLIENKEIILECFKNKSWHPYSQSMDWLPFPKTNRKLDFLLELNNETISETTKKLWPKLALISCWDTSTSRTWSEDLKKMFKHCNHQGKGIWATEAVITIPIHDKYPLTYRSHFYEFECIETSVIYQSWNLLLGMKVYPIITSGNGIYRYKIDDILEVNDYLNEVPCFKFIGRKNTIDMVGEKMDSESALSICKEFGAISLFAVRDHKNPYYLLLIEQSKSVQSDQLEKRLKNFFHYNLARDLKQLSDARVVTTNNPLLTYYKLIENSNTIEGNIKIEPLNLIEDTDKIRYVEQLCLN